MVLRVEDTYFTCNSTLRIGNKLLDLSDPKIMAILNITADSFYAASRHNSDTEILTAADNAISAGADMLDIGAYSSRPGATDIPEKEEINRILTAIRLIRKEFPETLISIDTFRPETARIALEEGAGIINDISGGNEEMYAVAARYRSPYILMHMRGTPATMQRHTQYDTLIGDMGRYFSERIAQLEKAGVHDIVLDPGYGFSKTTEQNYELLRSSDSLRVFGKPILTGVSRKSMWYKYLKTSPEEALNASTAGNLIALLKGSSILRVHDVKEACELVKILQIMR